MQIKRRKTNQADVDVLMRPYNSHRIPVLKLLKCSKPECGVSTYRGGISGIFHHSHILKSLTKCVRRTKASNPNLRTDAYDTSSVQNPQGMPLSTRREEKVVQLVAGGMKIREIARRLKVNEHSVRNYFYRISEKLGASSRVELILYVFNHRDRGN